jgi:hypothetical protein
MQLNRERLALAFGVSVGAVDRWTADGMPVVRRGRRGVAASYDLAACIAWVRERDRRHLTERLSPLPKTHERQPRASRAELRGILRNLWLGQDFMLPWHPGTPEVMDLLEYEKHVGLSHESGEILDWLQLGCPNLPPAEGEKLLRIPRRNAELWRLLFGGLIETCGGDGEALLLGREMRLLCGMPLLDDEEG